MSAIKIDGTEYDLPDPGSVTMGEAVILERYCGGHAEGDSYGVAKLAGLMHIAVARVKPSVPFDEIREVIEGLPLNEIQAQFPEGDAGPPIQKLEDASASSSDSSEPASDASPESENPNGSGAQDSDTGFHSFHATSAA